MNDQPILSEGDPKVIKEPVCYGCEWLIVWPYCMAFPRGIPDEIRQGLNNHTEPIEGDHGIQFEPVQEEEAENGD